MQQVTLELPDELSAYLAASGQDLSRAAVEAIALEAYREGSSPPGSYDASSAITQGCRSMPS